MAWLAGHMRRHPKDYHSRRGLEMVLARRRKLLTYLRGNNFDAYALLLTRLNLKDNYAKEVRGPPPCLDPCTGGTTLSMVTTLSMFTCVSYAAVTPAAVASASQTLQ